jgi:hypothetical protein
MAMLKVVLVIDQLTCESITYEPAIEVFGHNDRDEVYFMVSGSSADGLFSQRLPTLDDYYEFRAGFTAVATDFRTWTNKDQSAVGRPVLWAGTLADNEAAEVFVTICEQDNRDLGPLKAALKAGKARFDAALAPKLADPVAKSIAGAVDDLINAIPDVSADDVIGAFVVHVRNQNNNLEVGIAPWPEYQVQNALPGATTIINNESLVRGTLPGSGQRSAELHFQSTQQAQATQQGYYRGVVTARIVDTFTDQQYQFVGTEIDRCGADTLIVAGANRMVRVGQGQTDVRVDVPNNRFYWYCGENNAANDDKDWTTAPALTDFVLVSRGAARKIEWKCYRDASRDLSSFARRGYALAPAENPSKVFRQVPEENNLDLTWISADPAVTWPFPEMTVQGGWRHCKKCQGLFFRANHPSVCPAGGEHDDVGSGRYALFITDAAGAGLQGSWRYCKECKGLWNTDWTGLSVCPATADRMRPRPHSQDGSGAYALIFMNLGARGGEAGGLQGNWHWCQKCWGLWSAGNGIGVCPAGRGHLKPGAALDYKLLHAFAA